ncbi:MAG: hypothetical protein EZS28_025267 [Streblomastix strix]|uniref:U-box domain-containing protein n=1 Tax=Streblomastix strix TaxID=222440 RepID=A0A5J4V9L9_9EUKA|nr:MAG: hypothetical protein EZS28_025267 [Streblomastix strix]
MNREEQQNEGFICPITHEIMIDPVIAKDGISYERQVIVYWLKVKKMSPITRQPVNGRLLPNIELKKQIQQPVISDGIAYYEVIVKDLHHDGLNGFAVGISNALAEFLPNQQPQENGNDAKTVRFWREQINMISFPRSLHFFVDNMEEDYYVTKIPNAVHIHVICEFDNCVEIGAEQDDAGRLIYSDNVCNLVDLD